MYAFQSTTTNLRRPSITPLVSSKCLTLPRPATSSATSAVFKILVSARAPRRAHTNSSKFRLFQLASCLARKLNEIDGVCAHYSDRSFDTYPLHLLIRLRETAPYSTVPFTICYFGDLAYGFAREIATELLAARNLYTSLCNRANQRNYEAAKQGVLPLDIVLPHYGDPMNLVLNGDAYCQAISDGIRYRLHHLFLRQVKPSATQLYHCLIATHIETAACCSTYNARTTILIEFTAKPVENSTTSRTFDCVCDTSVGI